MSDTISKIYIRDTKSEAVFAADGPRPQFLLDTPKFKVLVAGLEAGSQIPVHPAEAAMYHFLEGEGLMTVGDEVFSVEPGTTVIVASGERRGMNAKTRLVFLASKGEQ